MNTRQLIENQPNVAVGDQDLANGYINMFGVFGCPIRADSRDYASLGNAVYSARVVADLLAKVSSGNVYEASSGGSEDGLLVVAPEGYLEHVDRLIKGQPIENFLNAGTELWTGGTPKLLDSRTLPDAHEVEYDDSYEPQFLDDTISLVCPAASATPETVALALAKLYGAREPEHAAEWIRRWPTIGDENAPTEDDNDLYDDD